MPRYQLFEFEDLRGFPQVIREGMMDFLRHAITWLNFYKPIVPFIKETLEQCGETTIVELCSGGGGGVLKLRENLDAIGCHPKIILSDLYPNVETYENLKKQTNAEIDFISEPVDALNVPSSLKGMRVLFSSFHHFTPEQANSILQDAVSKNVPIGIFDAGTKSIFSILGIILLQPAIFFVATPFFRPFRWNRLLFTYILLMIPLCTMWDGCVSVLRFYTVKQLKDLTNQINSENYIWKVGQVKNSIGAKVNYVIGYPEQRVSAPS